MAVMTIRPMSNGVNNFGIQPSSANAIDVVTDNNSDTYLVYVNGTSSNGTAQFACSFNTNIANIGAINKVTVRVKASGVPGHGDSYVGDAIGNIVLYVNSVINTYSCGLETTDVDMTWNYTTNPNGNAWVWNDFNNLSFIVCSTNTGLSTSYIKEIYLDVDYTPSVTNAIINVTKMGSNITFLSPRANVFYNVNAPKMVSNAIFKVPIITTTSNPIINSACINCNSIFKVPIISLSNNLNVIKVTNSVKINKPTPSGQINLSSVTSNKNIIIYDKNETNFAYNGLAILSDCINCEIEEELNGNYSLNMEYPLDDKGKYKFIIQDNIIKANGQLFRIHDVITNMNSVKIEASHVFYDLLDNFLEDVRCENKTGVNAIQHILDNTQYPHNFTCNGNVTSTNTKYFVRTNPANAILGKDGIIENWGGELVRDNFNIGIWQNRGNDNSILIMGGKNLIGIEDNLNDDNVCTRLMPVGKDGLLLVEKYIDSQYIGNYSHPKIRTVEFSEIEDEITLRTTATKYMQDNKIDIPTVNYSVDFVDLSTTKEYKDYKILQTVDIGDLVTIRYSKRGIDIKAKVISTNKKLINGVWVNDKIQLGNFQKNINDRTNDMHSNMQNLSSTLSNITTVDGQVKASEVKGIIDATKASFHAMADAVNPQVEKAMLFEDRDTNSKTYGAMALGTKGFEIASVMTNGEWQWSTFGTGKGFIADMIIAGKILGNNAEFNLDEGYLKVTHSDGSYSKIDSNGFNRYVNNTKKEYHYLIYTKPLYLEDIKSIEDDDPRLFIQLPVEFKGKPFTVTANITKFFSFGSEIDTYHRIHIPTSFTAYVEKIDYANATFNIVPRSAGYTFDYINNTTSYEHYTADMEITYTVIA